jgi:hypothetical protein
MHLAITTDSPRTLRLSSEALHRILVSWLRSDVASDVFLRRCGIQVHAVTDGVEIGFTPETGIRINEQAVSHILGRRLLHRVSQDPFLDKCNIRLTVKEEE